MAKPSQQKRLRRKKKAEAAHVCTSDRFEKDPTTSNPNAYRCSCNKLFSRSIVDSPNGLITVWNTREQL